MKLLTAILLLSLSAVAEEQCTQSDKIVTQDVTYEVNTNTPSHLKGATITITLADGRTSTVSADKFMVVPRTQKTIVGQNKAITSKVTCKAGEKKNIVVLEARKDVTELESETTISGASTNIKVSSKKEIIPGLNYYRRQVISNFGAGAGVDTNGTLKALVGLEF